MIGTAGRDALYSCRILIHQFVAYWIILTVLNIAAKLTYSSNPCQLLPRGSPMTSDQARCDAAIAHFHAVATFLSYGVGAITIQDAEIELILL